MKSRKNIRNCIQWCLSNCQNSTQNTIDIFDVCGDKQIYDVSFWYNDENIRKSFDIFLNYSEIKEIEKLLILLDFNIERKIRGKYIMNYNEYLNATNKKDNKDSWIDWKIECCGMSIKEAKKAANDNILGYKRIK